MPETRYIESYEAGTGRLLSRTPYVVSDEEVAKEADEQEVRDRILAQGRAALANWDNLNNADIKRIVRALLRYVLWRES